MNSNKETRVVVAVTIPNSRVTFFLAEEGLVLDRDVAIKFTNPHVAAAAAAAIRNNPLNQGHRATVEPLVIGIAPEKAHGSQA
jgi:hypothetical protein